MPLSKSTYSYFDSSRLENFLQHILEMGVDRRFDFRRDWKFFWDLSNFILYGNWLLRWDCFFQVGFFYPSANYVIFIMTYFHNFHNAKFWHQRNGNIHSFTLTFSFSGCFLNLKLRKTYSQVRKYT